jgi:hypothetical protein
MADKETQPAKSSQPSYDPALIQQLIDQNKALAQRINDMEVGKRPVLQKVTEHTVRLRKVDGHVVLGYANRSANPAKPLYVYDEWSDIEKEKVQFVDLILEGVKDPKKMRYVDFLNESERVDAKVVAKHKLDTPPIIQGYVNKREFDGKYSMVEKDFLVPVEIHMEVYTFDVEFPDGTKMEGLHESVINI